MVMMAAKERIKDVRMIVPVFQLMTLSSIDEGMILVDEDSAVALMSSLEIEMAVLLLVVVVVVV